MMIQINELPEPIQPWVEEIVARLHEVWKEGWSSAEQTIVLAAADPPSLDTCLLVHRDQFGVVTLHLAPLLLTDLPERVPF